MMEFREQFKGTGVIENAKSDNSVKFAPFEKYLQEWQNPHQADKLL